MAMTFQRLNIKRFGARPYPPPTEADIRAFEAHFETILPQEYCAFLRFRNGGAPLVATIRVGRVEYGVNDFFGLGSREAGLTPRVQPDEEWDYGNLWAETRVAREVIEQCDVPIARDSGGSLFYLHCGEEPGAVRILLGDTRQIRNLAPSFSAFIDCLRG